jgi:hypothetical protein
LLEEIIEARAFVAAKGEYDRNKGSKHDLPPSPMLDLVEAFDFEAAQQALEAAKAEIDGG